MHLFKVREFGKLNFNSKNKRFALSQYDILIFTPNQQFEKYFFKLLVSKMAFWCESGMEKRILSIEEQCLLCHARSRSWSRGSFLGCYSGYLAIKHGVNTAVLYKLDYRVFWSSMEVSRI